MNFLEEKILRSGVVKEGNVLKVDSFLNHQLDVELLDRMGKEFYDRFKDRPITKVLTIEASGIAIACFAARYFGVPVVYDAKRWGYYITEPEFKPYELRLMVDSIQSSKFITQTEAQTISRKIAKLGDIYTRPSLTDRHAWVSDRVRSANDDVVREADRIHAAIARNLKIRFRYFHYTPNRANPKKYSKNGDFYTVSPYAMLWDNGNYYLYAYTEKGVFRTFRIDRMERISNPLQEERDGEKEFKAEAITAKEYKVFQMFHGEQVKVRVQFSNHLADAVIDQFGKNTILVPEDDGHFIVLLPVELSPPFFAWIATFGRGAKILSPEAAVDKMRDFIQRCSDMYNNEGEK